MRSEFRSSGTYDEFPLPFRTPDILSWKIFIFLFQKELEDLAAFEALEEIACDSSFCSSSSKVKNLIDHSGSIADKHVLPSPITKPRSFSQKSITSTPKPPSAGETLYVFSWAYIHGSRGTKSGIANFRHCVNVSVARTLSQLFAPRFSASKLSSLAH